MSFQLQTPVVFIIFCRSETTRQAFEIIRAAKPSRLFVIADGPRTPAEQNLVNQTRAIIDEVDWPCVVQKNYVEANMGLKRRISSGLDWVFDQVEEAIILEDDCLPDPTFFRFCEELLEYYRNEPRVMHISANNYQSEQHRKQTETSYYFSRYPYVSSWATWQRAWALFDVEIEHWSVPQDRERVLASFERTRERHFWETVWNGVCQGKISSWAFAWSFACFLHNGLAITPNVNLVENIGFGQDATHTTSAKDFRVGYAASPMTFPLTHPENVQLDFIADKRTARLLYMLPSRFRVFGAKVKKFLKRIVSFGG